MSNKLCRECKFNYAATCFNRYHHVQHSLLEQGDIRHPLHIVCLDLLFIRRVLIYIISSVNNALKKPDPKLERLNRLGVRNPHPERVRTPSKVQVNECDKAEKSFAIHYIADLRPANGDTRRT